MVLPFLIPVAATIAAEVLPSLVSRIAGPRAGDVAEEVVETAAAAAGISGSLDAREILERLRLDAKAQAELRIKLAEIENREEERVLEDRVSARARDLERARSGRTDARSNVMLLMAFVALIGCIVLVVWQPWKPLQPAEIGLLTTVSGVLLKMLSDAFAFEFGSSQGSKDKDDQIRRFQQQLADVSRERAAENERQTRLVRDVSKQARETVADVARTTTAAAMGAASAPRTAAGPTFAERLRRRALSS